MERKKPIIFHQYPKVLKQDFEVFAKTCTHTHTHTLMYGYTPNACICMCMCMCVCLHKTFCFYETGILLYNLFRKSLCPQNKAISL